MAVADPRRAHPWTLISNPDAHGIFWLPCDDPADGDFLLAGLDDDLTCAGRAVSWVVVPPDDPVMVWGTLLGEQDRRGALGRAVRRSILLMEGGARLPVEGFADHGPTVARAVLGAEVVLVWPVQRDVLCDRLRRLGTVQRAASYVRPQPRAVRVGVELLAMIDPEESLGPRVDVARLLASGAPNSRAELQSWIERYVRLGVCAEIPPPGERWRGTPRPLVRAADLSGLVRHGIACCGRLSALYLDWLGASLLPLPHLDAPDAAQEMRGYFVSCVSWLATLLFDSASPAFRTVGRLERRGASIGFTTGAPPFMADLRSLRTYFQHGLDWTRPHDVETRDRVAEWCFVRCGASVPAPASWRKLSLSLLSEWSRFLDEVEDTSRQVRDAGTSELRAQIAAAFREIDPQEWASFFVEAAEQFAPHLSGAEVERRRGDRARAELRESGVVPGRERHQARLIARRHVVEIGADCPLKPASLIEAGFRGRGVAMALDHAGRLFRAQPDADMEALLAACLQEWPQHRGGA